MSILEIIAKNGQIMLKFSKKTLLVLGVLLLLNGFGNIIDDARVLTYDLTSIFAGLGFVVLSRQR